MPSRLLPPLLAILALGLAGCLPESKNPLSLPEKSTIDPRLEGVYVQRREKGDDGLSVWHLHYRGEKSPEGKLHRTPWLEALNIVHPTDEGLKGAAYRALTTTLGDHNYISFVELGPVGSKSPPSLYRFARYEISLSGDLRIWLMDTKIVANAVTAGTLHGEVRHTQAGDDVLLNEPTDHLVAFVRGSDTSRLFGGKPLILYHLTK
jgi:hypothetical protein